MAVPSPAFPSRHRARAWRRDALAVRRNLRGDVPDAGLRLPERRGGRGPLQGRGPRLRLFPLRQSDRRHVRGAHVPAGGRRGEPRRRRAAWPPSAAALVCDLKAGDHVVSSRALFGSCQYVVADLLPRFGVSSTLVDGTDLEAWRRCRAAGNAGLLPGEPVQSDAGTHRHRRRGGDRARRRGAAGRRQRLRHAAVPEAPGARGAYGGLFGHQAYRRAGALPRRHRAVRREPGWRRSSPPISSIPAPRSARSTPGSCSSRWKPWRSASSGRPGRPPRWPTAWPTIRPWRGCSIPATGAIRSMRWPSGR